MNEAPAAAPIAAPPGLPAFPVRGMLLLVWGAWFLAGVMWLAAVLKWNLCGTQGCQSGEWPTYAWLFRGRVPLAALGFGAYAVLLGQLWAVHRQPGEAMHRLFFGATLYAVAGAELYLVWLQAVPLGNFCWACSLVALLGLSAAGLAWVRREAVRAGTLAALVCLPAGFAGMHGFFAWARTEAGEAGRELAAGPVDGSRSTVDVPAGPPAVDYSKVTGLAPAWHSIGKADAPLLVEIFYDYKCPMCRMIELEDLPKLRRDYVDPGKLRVVFRHSFIPDKPEGQDASAVCDAASYQGKFLEAHHRVYERQGDWHDGPGILDQLRDVLDLKRLVEDMQANYAAINQHIRNDIEYSHRVFPKGYLVPSLLFRRGDDRRVVAGRPDFSVIRKTVEEMLSK